LKRVSLSIDGKIVDCFVGTSLLKAAETNGIKIPGLCDHPELKPIGACRLCLVEDEKTGRLMASCVTPAVQDMVIRTDSDRIKKHRRNIVRLMLAEHPESCLVCNKGNRCRLRQIAADLGIGETDLYAMPNVSPFEQANPFIVRDLSKCILCGKCIRADHELVVVGAIDYNNRGFKSRPATVHALPLEHSSCTFCGTCVSICPTGALSPNTLSENRPYVGTPAIEAHSICGFCGVGCALVMGAVDHQIVEVNPSHLPGTVNKSTLCVRGHFAHDFLNNPNRLTHPSIRKDGQLTAAPWDEALELIAGRLLEIKTTEGPQSIALLGSSKCTNEENYIFQRIARLLIGTNNVDNTGYFSGMSLLRRLDEKTAGKCRVNPLDNLDKAEVVLILGADPTHSTPVVGYYLKRAAKQGVPLIVVDPRQTDLVDYSSIRLRIKPQTDLELVNGLTALLYEKKGYDHSFIDRHTEGFHMLESGLSSLDLDRVCRITGLEMKTLSETAELLKGKKIAIVIGNGILQQKNGIHSLEAVLNLFLMSGSLGAAGAGIYVLAKENNQIGAMDMGAVPDLLPGRQSITDDAVRHAWEQRWKVKLPSDPGLNIFGMIEAAEKGNLKALYVMGENPLRALPQPQRVKKALQNLDFLVVQDVLKNETTDIADVILPGAAFCEKAGSFTNLEGRIQAFAGVVSPPGAARPDWEILDRLSAKLGVNETYGSLERIRTEIRIHVPMYTELQDDGQGWINAPHPKAIADSAPADSSIPFSPITSVEDEPPDNDYPFTSILGSLRFHLGSGTRTTNSRRILGFGLKGEVEISPEDGVNLGLIDGDSVRIASEHGVIEREIRMDERIGQGQIFIPLAINENDAMNLIGLSDLSAPESSGVKTCPVRLTKA